MTTVRVAGLACAMALVAGSAAGQGSAPDPLKSPACLAARERLDAVMAEPKPDIVQLRATRTRAARACFREEADAAERAPARLERPRLPTPLVAPAVPQRPDAVPAVRPTAPAPPAPAQVQRCDTGGCWDTDGQRLNKTGNQLVDGWGRLCAQQGTVLSCR